MNIPGFSKEALTKVAELLYAEEAAQTGGTCPPKKPKETQPQQPPTPPTPPTPQPPAPAPPVQTQAQKDEAAKRKNCTQQPDTATLNPK
jgi:hypothetical protein